MRLTHRLLRSMLNDEAPLNIPLMLVTLLTFHEPMG